MASDETKMDFHAERLNHLQDLIFTNVEHLLATIARGQ